MVTLSSPHSKAKVVVRTVAGIRLISSFGYLVNAIEIPIHLIVDIEGGEGYLCGDVVGVGQVRYTPSHPR